MNPELLEQVLACRNLPTLPAVAMRVVELTSSDRVSMRELAEAIQHDPALAAKVLRTVNSSMFGLRSKCASINQAIVMLGLSTVKTLALGFTLVGAIKDTNTGTFDLQDYWKRALYSGIAARTIAVKAGLTNAEEAFLGGLLQDVGMIALYQTLGLPYLGIIAGAEGDHRKVAKLEMDALETQHADVGAMLATRWKLPQSLVMPIKYHERATAAPIEHTGICRAVGLGNIAADILSSDEPAPHLRRFYQRAEQWFALTEMQSDDTLKQISTQTREIGKLLNVQTGAIADAEAVLAQARTSLESIKVSLDDESAGTGRGLTPQVSDELTGVANRFRVDQVLVGAIEQTRLGVGVLSVALFHLDGLDDIVEQYGSDASDTVLISLAGRIDRAFSGQECSVGRYDDKRFIVVMPRIDRASAVRLCERARGIIASEPVKLIAGSFGTPSALSVTCSTGLASFDQRSIDRFEDTQGVLNILEQALRAAQKAGRNLMRVYAPAVAA